MSQENVEVVRQMVEAARRGDWETAMSFYEETVELDQSRMPDGGIYNGLEGVRRFFGRWFASWDEFEIEPQQLIDAGDQVVSIDVIRGTGKGSGVEVTMRSANIYTLQNGRVVRHAGYPDASDALEAVGLSE
jgi:ketosteroid isomerase-like protein